MEPGEGNGGVEEEGHAIADEEVEWGSPHGVEEPDVKLGDCQADPGVELEGGEDRIVLDVVTEEVREL
jgi:hypothetical protein